MEQTNFGPIVSFLFGIANDCLVDVYDVGDYRKIILPMMVAIERINRQISFLREYRIRLISDVVTGQVDVRDVIIPDYTAEEDTDDENHAVDDTESEVNGDE